MMNRNKVGPANEGNDLNSNSQSPIPDYPIKQYPTQKELNDVDSVSTVGLEESSYLKLKPFSKLDPTVGRLILFLNCFGLFVSCKQTTGRRDDQSAGNEARDDGTLSRLFQFFRLLLMAFIVAVSSEVVYDVNLRQSKLLAEQKRSTPLLTFVIVGYSWLSLVIPIMCDISLLLIGSLLFRFYSRTMATLCNGLYFGRRTSVDYWYYHFLLVLIAFLDALGQIILLGVWPKSLDPYMRVLIGSEGSSMSSYFMDGAKTSNQTSEMHSSDLLANFTSQLEGSEQLPAAGGRVIKAHILDYLLGPNHANGDLGVCIKLACLMVQFVHSYAFFIVIISLAHHYASAINDINENLDKYEFRKLLKQLIILRDSSEQISLIISVPFSCITILGFMRAIALNGVIIQSTMLPYENWAVSLQAFTCIVSIIMVFIYCDGLQSASKQTHRLKTEHIVIDENKGGNQSIYEFLDYLNRLSKSIRITFFNIIAINKGSLIGLFGHILTLTFVTS